MKILINRKTYFGPIGGGYQFINNFYHYFLKQEFEVVNKLERDIDVILLFDPRPEDGTGVGLNEILRYKYDNPSVNIIHRVNECDARKKTNDIDHLLRECSRYTDVSCFIGNWVKEYHIEKGWNSNSNLVIYSGTDQNWFKPNIKYSDTDGKVHLVSHHWSNNFLKEQGLNQWLDEFVGRNKDFTFTYIGRTDVRFKNAKHIQPLFGQALGDELGKYDVCVNKSYMDPMPNSCLEILSCKIPLYCHIDGGGATEAAGEDHLFDTFDDLEKILLNKNYQMNKSFVPYSWDECMKQYFDLIYSL